MAGRVHQARFRRCQLSAPSRVHRPALRLVSWPILDRAGLNWPRAGRVSVTYRRVQVRPDPPAAEIQETPDSSW